MRILIDSNILLDVILRREPFFSNSRAILEACQKEILIGTITAQTVADIFYILRKDFSYDERCTILLSLCEILFVSPVGKRQIVSALKNNLFEDFEDCLQSECALYFHADYIVTRNVKDFLGSHVPAALPEEILAAISSSE